MKTLIKAAVIAFGGMGALALPAAAQPYDPPDGYNGPYSDYAQTYGPDPAYDYGPDQYGQDDGYYGPDYGYCDPYYGCPDDFYDLPLYYGQVFYGGAWYPGPFYYRDFGGRRMFWVHGGWRDGNWRGGHFGPALGRNFYQNYGGGRGFGYRSNVQRPGYSWNRGGGWNSSPYGFQATRPQIFRGGRDPSQSQQFNGGSFRARDFGNRQNFNQNQNQAFGSRGQNFGGQASGRQAFGSQNFNRPSFQSGGQRGGGGGGGWHGGGGGGGGGWHGGGGGGGGGHGGGAGGGGGGGHGGGGHGR